MKLVATDVDGVIFDINSSWREFHKHFNTYDLPRLEQLRNMYLNGLISYMEWAEEEVKVWKGLPYSKFEEICMNFPLVNGSEDAVRALKARGYYLVAVSSGGLRRPVEKRLKGLGYDEVYSNDLEEVDGKVTGKFILAVEHHKKHEIIDAVLNRLNLGWKDCIVVGDDINDTAMLRRAGLSIAFCPKDLKLVKAADVVIKEKDLRKILEFI